jgi:REP element-mobilizing transposase RayT
MSPSTRLKHRDYAAPGLYFVTACSDFKRCIFGKVESGTVRLSSLGRIAEEAWLALPDQFPKIRLPGHMVMPNHVHGIIEIYSEGLAHQAASWQRTAVGGLQLPRPPLLSIIVRSFKANVTRRTGIELGWSTEIWQHNYYDRVIRDDREFANAMRYIAENPIQWQHRGEKSKVKGIALKKKSAQQAAPLQRERA